jgi:phage protein D
MTLDVDGDGVPDIFADAIVLAQDFDPDVDGEYVVKTVTHTFDGGSAYKTAVNMETRGSQEATEATPEA